MKSNLSSNLHHKLTRYTGQDYPTVEIFRQGDLVDFSLGIVKCGVPDDYVRQVGAAKKSSVESGSDVQMVSVGERRRNSIFPKFICSLLVISPRLATRVHINSP